MRAPPTARIAMEAEELKLAVRTGDVDALSRQLSGGEEAVGQVVGEEGFSLLHWACAYDRPEVCRHSNGRGVSALTPPLYLFRFSLRLCSIYWNEELMFL